MRRTRARRARRWSRRWCRCCCSRSASLRCCGCSARRSRTPATSSTARPRPPSPTRPSAGCGSIARTSRAYVENAAALARPAERDAHGRGRGQRRHRHDQLAAAGRRPRSHTHTVVGHPHEQLMRPLMTARHHNRGFSIVELMVAVTIAIITGLVVLQVLSTYESRRRTLTVGTRRRDERGRRPLHGRARGAHGGRRLHDADRPALRQRHERLLQRRDARGRRDDSRS